MFDFVIYYNSDTSLETFQIFQAHIKDKKNYTILNEYNEFKIDVYFLLDNPDSKMISFDWDNTVGEDIPFYSALMDRYLEAGFTPIICTLRSPEKDNQTELRAKLGRDDIPFYYTNGMPKRKYMKLFGYHINMWIDDFFPAICKEDNPLLHKNNIKY